LMTDDMLLKIDSWPSVLTRASNLTNFSRLGSLQG
jgi:hypothetical protein